jgi:16S rRNA (uracil1498-N3)-methyltransferase
VKTIRTPLEGLAAGERVLAADTSRYLCRVLRLTVGDRIVVFDPDTHVEGEATITLASADAARLRIGELRRPDVVAEAELVLIYALAKGDKVDLVVRDATELGATRIVIVQTERCIVKASAEKERDRAASKKARWKRVAEQAARQCGRADPPAVDGIRSWSDALDDASACEARFCLDPRAVVALGTVLAPLAARRASIAFAIGPEGGLSSAEIDLAVERGFVPASLGPFVLRTETVAAAVLGAVRVLFGADLA